MCRAGALFGNAYLRGVIEIHDDYLNTIMLKNTMSTLRIKSKTLFYLLLLAACLR